MKALVEIFGEAILTATFQSRPSERRDRAPREERFEAGDRNESRWRAGYDRDGTTGLRLSSQLLDRS